MSDPYLELMETLRPGREPLSAERRARDFQMEIQRIPNGEEIVLRGFLLLRKPPNAPRDAAYYLLSPLSPSDIKSLSHGSPRPYVVLRIDSRSLIKAKFLSGSYVEVKGIADSYPWGNLRMLRVLSLWSVEYSRYWKEYRDVALRPNEVEDLIAGSIYTNHEFQLGLIYALYGSPPVLESSRNWSEGYEFTVLGYGGRKSSLLTMWRILKFLYSLFPPELRFKRDKGDVLVDEFLDLDFTVFDPNNTPVRYYVSQSPGKVGKSAEKAILSKKVVGLLPLPRKADPRDIMTGKAETPFVSIPDEDERPYLENGEKLRRYLPNLIATVFIERERISTISTSDRVSKTFQRKFENWLVEKRDEYGWMFDVLTISGSVFDVGTRYELSLRLLGSIARLRGGLKRSHIGRVKAIKDEILNDRMAVLSSISQSDLQRLLRNYRGYVPHDRRTAKALQIFRDLAYTTPGGDVERAEFEGELLMAGFTEESAKRIVDALIREGYIYEPSAGRLKLVR